jgi:hypothetical protein
MTGAAILSQPFGQFRNSSSHPGLLVRTALRTTPATALASNDLGQALATAAKLVTSTSTRIDLNLL